MNRKSDAIRRRIDHLAAGKSWVIDGDVHVTDPDNLPASLSEQMASSANYFHGRTISADDAIQEMDGTGIDMALIWQNPSATPYTDDRSNNFETLLAANRYVARSAERKPDRFIPAGWTDPKALGLDGAVELVKVLSAELGFVIIKMNPAQNQYPIDSPDVIATVEAIVQSGAVPAFHYGADTPFTPPDGLQAIATRFPDTPIIGVHMGGGGASYLEAEDHYLKTRQLGLDHANLFFILSAKRDTHIASDLITYQQAGPPFSQNIACASDAPYGLMAWNFGGYRLLFDNLIKGATYPDARLRADPDLFSKADAQRYLGGNLADLVIKASRKWLSIHDR